MHYLFQQNSQVVEYAVHGAKSVLLDGYDWQ